MYISRVGKNYTFDKRFSHGAEVRLYSIILHYMRCSIHLYYITYMFTYTPIPLYTIISVLYTHIYVLYTHIYVHLHIYSYSNPRWCPRAWRVKGLGTGIRPKQR